MTNTWRADACCAAAAMHDCVNDPQSYLQLHLTAPSIVAAHSTRQGYYTDTIEVLPERSPPDCIETPAHSSDPDSSRTNKLRLELFAALHLDC